MGFRVIALDRAQGRGQSATGPRQATLDGSVSHGSRVDGVVCNRGTHGPANGSILNGERACADKATVLEAIAGCCSGVRSVPACCCKPKPCLLFCSPTDFKKTALGEQKVERICS